MEYNVCPAFTVRLKNSAEPLDPRIVVKEVPQRLMAVITYSGTWSIKRFENKKALLMAFMENKGLQPEVRHNGHGIMRPSCHGFSGEMRCLFLSRRGNDLI